MIEKLGVKSLVEVGCGRGMSSLWFHLHGVKTQCVEGSHDAVEKNLLKIQYETADENLVYEHDFSRGPW